MSGSLKLFTWYVSLVILCLRNNFLVQAEINGSLKRYAEAADALEAAVQHDASFGRTAEYKSLSKQLRSRLD